ncbi:MAG: ATP-binding protein [Oscillospiraceae bacterium]
MAQIDAKLIVQVIINLVDNAIKYTPPGSKLTLDGNKKEATSIFPLQITDRESLTEDKPHIFDMFYSASIRLRIAAAAWGWVWHCVNRLSMHMEEKSWSPIILPHGSTFTFSVPSGEVELHE